MNILVKCFWATLILSILFAIVMAIPEIAVYLRIMYLSGGAYLGFPGALSIFAFYTTFIFTNLWWVLILLTPVVLYRQGNLLKGFAISAIAFTALFFIPPLIIKAQTNSLISDAETNIFPIQNIQAIKSVTIFRKGCDELCERLLGGNMVTIVRTLKPKESKARHLLYKRAPIQECEELDSLFDDKKLCILAYPDDGLESDLVIESNLEGSGFIKRTQVGFTPRIFMKQSITVKENKTQNIVATDMMVRWLQPLGYVPLISNTGFDGRGIHGGGLVPRQIKHKTAPIEAAALLQKTGINLAPSLLRKEKNSKKYRSRPKIYRIPAPYDEALENSIRNLNKLKEETVYWKGYWRIKK